MSRTTRIATWLELLAQARMPTGAIVVAPGSELLPWTRLLTEFGVSNVMVIDTLPAANVRRPKNTPESGPHHAVLSHTAGDVVFHRSNLEWTSGEVDPAQLSPLWPGIRETGRETRQATTLSRLLAENSVTAAWVVIDLLPADFVLEGFPEVQEHTEAVVVRALVSPTEALESCGIGRIQTRLAAAGLDSAIIETGRHPAACHALFLRRGLVSDHLSLKTRANLVAGEVFSIGSDEKPPAWLKNHLTILRTELSLIQSELSLAQDRGQLETVRQETEPPATREEAEKRWLEQLARKAKSQLQQDLWVLGMTSFKRGGFFVEFGATDGVLLSNSHLLEKEFGWHGICAEPNPSSYEALSRNRGCTLSPACIGPVTGEEVEFIFAEAYGGMARDLTSDQHAEKRSAYRETGHTTVLLTISLHDFLVEHNAPRTIDYLSIDTEGSEFAILDAFPFDRWDIRMLTVEHNYTEQRAKIRRLLERHGYTCVEARWDDWYYKPASIGGMPEAAAIHVPKEPAP